MDAVTLRAWRETAGLTQGQAADALGTSRMSLIRYETGERPIPDELAAKIGAAKPDVAAEMLEAGALPFDPVAEGLIAGPTTNEVFGAGMAKLWDNKPPSKGWQRVEGGIRIVKGSIPKPLNWSCPRLGWRSIVTRSGAVYDYETGGHLGQLRPTAKRRPVLQPST